MSKSKVLKIVLYGAESTGKTSLARQLAKHYQSSWSEEYLRSYVAKKLRKESIKEGENIVAYSELEQIAKGQIQNEERATKLANKLVFLDTNILMSQIYAEYYFEKSPDYLQKLANSRQYDLYLFLENDILWEADIQRDGPEVRNKLSLIFKNELSLRNLNFVSITGLGEQRFENCVKKIDKYLIDY
jgi:NadR type nicotinamide-nucleotide adenylyltransferase